MFPPKAVVGLIPLLALLAVLLNSPRSVPPAQHRAAPLNVGIGTIQDETGLHADKKLLMVNDKPFVPIGVSYHFTYNRDTWDDDLQAMHDLGLNTVRIDLAWRDVEPFFPGLYLFSALDDFLDCASKHGLYVVPVFSHTTKDFNTPVWYWPGYFEWSSVDQEGNPSLEDMPCIDHPGYRDGLRNYIEKTVSHIKGHPALLAYQVLNEPRYDMNRLYDYNPYSVAAFRRWLQGKYSSVDALNKAWSTAYVSMDEVQPWRDAGNGPPREGPELTQWSDWREFGYENLADFTGEMVHAIKGVDPGHPVIVAEMAWWWWGEQPYTGVSPLHIYRDADIVGYDLYPDSKEDASYFLLTSDMLSRYWDKPVWVMELNSKDGDPTGEETQEFVSMALEGGASGVFYFQWRDNLQDGGNYGVLDARGRRKTQYGALASTIRWLRGEEKSLVMAPPPSPDLYLVWPSSEVGQVSGSESPAWSLYQTAQRLVEGGLRLGLIAENLIHGVDPTKVITVRDGRLEFGKGPPSTPEPMPRGGTIPN